MVRAAFFVEQYVPVGPGYCAGVKVVDHRVTVLFTQRPIVHFTCIKPLCAAFGEYQALRWEGLMNQLFVCKIHPGTRPGLVPVVAYTPYIFSCGRILQNSAGTLVHQVAVMVPNDQFFTRKTRPLQGWAQIILYKVTFFLGCVQA